MPDGPPEVTLGKGMGWLPDYPDFRDYTTEKPVYPVDRPARIQVEVDAVAEMLKQVNVASPPSAGGWSLAR